MGRTSLGVLGAVLALLVLAQPAWAAYEVEISGFGALDGTQQMGTATCDPGDVAIGGGGNSSSSYDDLVLFNTSRPEPTLNPIGTSWVVWVDNYTGGAGNHPADARAVCDTSGEPGDYRIRTKERVVEDDTQKGATASCRGSEVVVGGGGRSSGVYTDETYLTSSTPVDDGDSGKAPDDGWKAVLNNDEGGGLTNTLDVFAVCDRKHPASKFTYVKRTKEVPDGTQRAAAAKCGDHELVGGGVSAAARYEHGVYISSSYPYPEARTWQTYMLNYDTPDGKARTVTVRAICKK